jgi:hypothetical protein
METNWNDWCVMKLKSAKDVLEVVRARGLQVHIEPGPPITPVLHRPRTVRPEMVTNNLLNALKAWRLEIMEEVKNEPTKET